MTAKARKYDIEEIVIRLNNLKKLVGSNYVNGVVSFYRTCVTVDDCDAMNLAYRWIKRRKSGIKLERFGMLKPIEYKDYITKYHEGET